MLDGWVAAAVIVAAPLNPGSDSLGFAGSRADSIRRYTMPSWVDSVESSPEWINLLPQIPLNLLEFRVLDRILLK